ncbi:MAG TPA: hypothetical protein VM687_03270 [Stenotrophomonas sp.]|nr:hypothetical protein [Stenotrophomonas sp.]
MLVLLLPVVWLGAAGLAPAIAQDAKPAATEATPAPAYATGDAWIDRQLEDIDAYARRYPASFVDELSRHLGLSRGYAEAVLRAPSWRPGDLYLACAWAHAVQGDCRDWVRAYSRNRALGWQAVLAGEGKPDNLAYRRVRHLIVASYDRWDRPITLDARLREQLGDAEQRLQRARAAHAPAAEPPAR